MANALFNPQVSGAGRFGRAGGRLAMALSTALALVACSPGHGTDCLKSTGDIITQRRAVARGLYVVTAFDNVDLTLVQDTATFAEVRAGKNLIDDITLTRKGNALEITNTSRCNWTRSYDNPRQVTLHLPYVNSLFLRGTGNVNTAGQWQQDTIFFHLIGGGDFDLNVRATQIYLDCYEIGDVHLRGTADAFNFTLGTEGRIFANGLTTKQCYFSMERDSNGDAHVRATERLGGTIAGQGTLFYSGNPAFKDLRVTGNGSAKAD